MAATQHPTMEAMAAVQPNVRGRIVSGMRWTFWLTAIAVPFTCGTSILLARVSPEVIGTYGILMVYIGIVSSLFYFGGDAVVIRYVPMLAWEKRRSFLLTYFLVILSFLSVWLVVAALSPHLLHYLLGSRSGSKFELQMLCLSPLYILFSLTVAAHKAVLEMRWAHLLLRLLTIGSFLLYAVLYLVGRSLLVNHYTGVIWGGYLGITAFATVVGLRHLLKLEEWQSGGRTLPLYLPVGFWRYTITTEQVSAISFLMQRLDLILVMNMGGLALLGKYVAILTVADSIRTANRFFVDTLLPSLANVLACDNVPAASQIISVNLRVLFLANLAGIGALMLLISPFLHVFGTQYADLRPSFVLLTLFYGLAAPGGIGGIILGAVGKQQHASWVCLAQLVMFTALFVMLWSHWGLLGAVVANGVATLCASVLLLVVARWKSGIHFSMYADYLAFVCIGGAAGLAVMHWRMPVAALDTAIFSIAIGVLLLTRKYTLTECKELARCFLPSVAR